MSLSPAATDLVLAMGLNDRLVGVSTFETDPAVRGKKPVVGDYQRIDWEQIGALKPQYLIVQGKPDRLPPGLADRCRQANVTLINIQIDRLADIQKTIDQLGQSLIAKEASEKLNNEFTDALRSLSPDGKRLPAMIVTGDTGLSVAGRNNFLDDLLSAAGGENVVTADGYVTLDREKLLSLRPEVIVLLLPNATDAVKRKAVSAYDGLDDLPAVKHKRLLVIDRADALVPNSRAPQLAAEMATAIRAAQAPASP